MREVLLGHQSILTASSVYSFIVDCESSVQYFMSCEQFNSCNLKAFMCSAWVQKNSPQSTREFYECNCACSHSLLQSTWHSFSGLWGKAGENPHWQEVNVNSKTFLFFWFSFRSDHNRSPGFILPTDSIKWTGKSSCDIAYSCLKIPFRFGQMGGQSMPGGYLEHTHQRSLTTS